MKKYRQLENYRALFTKVGLKKGNVYEYLDNKTINWLIHEAIKIKSNNTGIIIASIIKDAYVENNEDIEHDRITND